MMGERGLGLGLRVRGEERRVDLGCRCLRGSYGRGKEVGGKSRVRGYG